VSRLSRRILFFALAFTAFIVAPSFLRAPFAPMPLLEWGDAIDLITPLVLLPSYWSLFHFRDDRPPGFAAVLGFVALASLWGLGHGMHLAANSIGHLETGLDGTALRRLTDFYDEHLSHYLWHLGIIGLTVLLLGRQWWHPFTGEPARLGLPVVAGLVYGATYFVDVVESQTAPLGVPFALAVAVFGIGFGRRQFSFQPLLAFFSVGYLMACVLFGAWAAYWGGLPEFSRVGIIQ
jgi:hypothetical protein